VADLTLAIPPPRRISGDVTVVGSGPPPRFSLTLVRVSAGDAKAGLTALSENAYRKLEIEANDGLTQGITLRIDPLPDATFKMTLPEGEYRVATGPKNAIPPDYRLTSLSYGG